MKSAKYPFELTANEYNLKERSSFQSSLSGKAKNNRSIAWEGG